MLDAPKQRGLRVLEVDRSYAFEGIVRVGLPDWEAVLVSRYFVRIIFPQSLLGTSKSRGFAADFPVAKMLIADTGAGGGVLPVTNKHLKPELSLL